MSIYSTRVQPDTSGAMDDGEESTAAAAAAGNDERKQAGTTRHEHMQRVQRQQMVAPLTLGHSTSNSAIAATPTLSAGSHRPQSRLGGGGDAADDVASVMPPTPMHRLLSDGVNSTTATHAHHHHQHRQGRSSQSPLQSPRSPPAAEGLLGGLGGLGVSHSVVQSQEALDETLSQRVLASEAADDEPDHDERVATQEVKALGEAISMAPGPGSKGRRGSSSSSVSSSSAGGLVASLAPLATAAAPMDDVVAPAAADYSVHGASGAAAAAAHGAPVSPTSVASQFSNPSSGRQKFGLSIESVAPKEAEEENEEKEEEEEQTKNGSATAVAPRSSGRARERSEKAAAAQPAAESAATSAAAAAPAPASPAVGHSAVADRRREALAKKKLEDKAAAKEEARQYRAVMAQGSGAKGKRTKAAAEPAPSSRSKSRGGKATKRESSTEAEVTTISVPPAKKSRRSRASAGASTSAAAASADSAPPSPTLSAFPESPSGPLVFPPMSSAQVGSSFFEDDGFPSFIACDSSLPAQLYTQYPALRTRAPSSQSLHAVRVAIYRELAEEYFGRYMKESADAEEHTDTAAAASSHTPVKHHRRAKQAAAPKVDARAPEQLRMLFFDQFNECEQDRIPSTASVSQLTGLTIVNPIDPAKQLVSFGATDTSSMSRDSVPATYEDYQIEEHRRKKQSASPPMPLNPNFDLYQYAPLVPSDEYEEVNTQLAQMLEGEDDHPTLRAHTAIKGVSYKRGETEATELTPAAAAAAAAPASSDPVAAMDIDPVPAAASASNGHMAAVPAAAVAASAPSVPVAVAPTVVSVKLEGDASPSSVKVEGEASPADASMMADGAANGFASAAAITAAAAVPASSSSAAAASAAAPTAAAAAASVPLSLPPTAHGVGMLGALDFNSQGVRSYRDHWANSCFAWRFENASRSFSAHAYSTATSLNDAEIVSNILSKSQARFHAQLQVDEAEETEYEANLRPRRHGKAAKPEDDGEDESKNGHSDANGAAAAAVASASAVPTGIPATGPYSRDSPKWEKLKRRLRTSLEDSLGSSLFLPHTFLRDVSPKVHDRAQRMASECVSHLQSKVVLPAGEQCVDDVFKLVVPGFGCAGVQVFLKIGLCVTLLHDEIGWCSALNYMTSRSRGAALWIGLNMHKASAKMSKDSLRTLINATTFNLSEFLPKLRKLGLQPSMQVQTPGTCIYSPSGRGSAHIVITVGSWVEQIAINYSMSAAGLVSAVKFWDGVDPLLHNSALATRCVIPMLWLAQHRRWDLGQEIADQLSVLSTLVRAVKREGQHAVVFRDFDDPNDVELTCASCFKKRGAGYHRALLFVRINGQCPSCFVDSTKEYMHFANMIDRKFK